MVIRALPHVLKRVPDARYVIAGPGFDDERARLRTLAEETGVAERVVFAGELPLEDIPLMYNACDVYVMASRVLEGAGDVEGFGITFLEANACGKPVIGGRSGGVPDAIEDGVNGYLVTPTDVGEIAARLIALLTDDVLAKAMAERAIARIKAGFTWDRITAAILATVS
jgi:phosphatidylinositol alpha-1,6-mannosyltransferase